ncbi:MAG: PLP-dependent aminotransferase family protein [Roseiflexaceae bacterium]
MHIDDLFAARARDIPTPLYGPTPARHGDLISFSYGLADPDLFPHADLLAATAAVLQQDAAEALNYGPSFAGLREQIVVRLRAMGIEAEDDNVLVSYGSGQILALLPQVFVDPGDIVLIEGPSFMGAVRHFTDAGARLVTVPTDAQGMDVDALEELLRDLRRRNIRPKFVYTIPTFQNPTGTTMPLVRRQKLVALAAEYGVVVVEDDAYGDLRFEGQPIPNLAMLDQDGWVIRVSTFSKILAPGLRMGWAYAQPEIIARLATFKTEGASGPFLTRVVARYCAEGRLEAHIQELIALYRHKCNVMLDAIAREFPPEAAVLRPAGGFFVWCKLPSGMSAKAVLSLAEARGVTFLPGTRCFANGQGDDAIRLAFSFLPVNQIEEGIARIGAAIQST